MDTSFVSLMTDVTGTLRLDLQDPRWQQLLRCKKALLYTGNEPEYHEFYPRMIRNNKLSGNLHLLFELISGKIHQLMQKRSMTMKPGSNIMEIAKPVTGNVIEEQCCIGLHIISIFLCHFNSFLKPSEVEQLLELPNDWVPSNAQSHHNPHAGHTSRHLPQQLNLNTTVSPNCFAVTNLVDTTIRASMAYPSMPWMYDVACYSVSMLTAAISIQLFNPISSSVPSSHIAQGHIQVDHNPILNYIYNSAAAELYHTVTGHSEVASSFPAVLVRSWLLLASNLCLDTPSDSIVQQIHQQQRQAFSDRKSVMKSVRVGLQAGSSGMDPTLQVTNQSGSIIDLGSLPKLWASWYFGKFAGVFSDWLAERIAAAMGRPSPMQERSMVGVDEMGYPMPLPPPSPHLNSVDQAFATPHRNTPGDYVGAYSSQKQLTPPTVLFGTSQILDGSICEPLTESTSILSDRCKGMLLLLLHNRRSTNNKSTQSSRVPGQLHSGYSAAGTNMFSNRNVFREICSMLYDENVESFGQRQYSHGSTGGVYAEEESSWLSSKSSTKVGSFVSADRTNHHDFSQSQRVYVDLTLISKNISSGLPSNGHVLLLYSMLQIHHTFVEVLLASRQLVSVLERLLSGICQTCDGHGDILQAGSPKGKFPAGSSSNAHQPIAPSSFEIDNLYISIICILIIVQDGSICTRLQDVQINAQWLRGNSIALHQIPLLDAILLTVQRAIVVGLIRLKGDRYLLSNCFAICMNIAPHLCSIHSHTAERLVTVVTRLCKKVIREVEPNLNPNTINSFKSNSSSSDLGEILRPSDSVIDLHQQVGSKEYLQTTDVTLPEQSELNFEHIDSYADSISVMLRVIGYAVRLPRRVSNIHLVYALVHNILLLSNQLQHPVITYMLRNSAALTFDTQSPRDFRMAKEANVKSGTSPMFASGVQYGRREDISAADSTQRALSNEISTKEATMPTVSSLAAGVGPSSFHSNKIQIMVHQSGAPSDAADNSQAITLEGVWADDPCPTCLSPEQLLSLAGHFLQILEANADRGVLISATKAVEFLRECVVASTAHANSVHPADEALTRATYISYEEGVDPASFFVPHTWNLAVRFALADVAWNLREICLLDAQTSGLLTDWSYDVPLQLPSYNKGATLSNEMVYPESGFAPNYQLGSSPFNSMHNST